MSPCHLVTLSPCHATARTPLHHWHAAQKAHFADRDGWQVAAHYADVAAEIAAMRSGLAIADISAFAKLSLLGQGLRAWIPALVGDSPAAGARGVASLVADDSVLACRLTDDHLLLLASTTTTSLAKYLPSLPPNASVLQSDVTSAYAGFCLLGVHLEEVLRRVTPLDVAAAAHPVNACAETGLAGVPALLVRAAEFSVPALRIYVAWDLGEDVWERLLDAGRNLGLIPLGLDSFHQLRQVPRPGNLL